MNAPSADVLATREHLRALHTIRWWRSFFVFFALLAVFTHLGADPDGYDWDAGWSLCEHASAVGRWHQDSQILDFLAWLEREDPGLRVLLESGAYYAP